MTLTFPSALSHQSRPEKNWCRYNSNEGSQIVWISEQVMTGKIENRRNENQSLAR